MIRMIATASAVAFVVYSCKGKLAEAEREAEETGERFSSKDVLSAMKAAARGE